MGAVPEVGEKSPWKGLDIFSRFIEQLKEVYLDLVDKALERIKAETLGAEVAAFYNKLVSSGVPEDLAKELTKKYFEARLQPMKAIEELQELLFKQRSEPMSPEAIEAMAKMIETVMKYRKGSQRLGGGAAGEAREAGGADERDSGEA